MAQLERICDELAFLEGSPTSRSEWNGKGVSPVGWYLARVLMRAEYYDEDVEDLNRRCRASINTHLIRASSPEVAYQKALKIGRDHEQGTEFWEEGKEQRKDQWRFEGLTSLLAIHEELEDSAEISWADFQNRTVRKVKSWVLAKEELEVFEKA